MRTLQIHIVCVASVTFNSVVIQFLSDFLFSKLYNDFGSYIKCTMYLLLMRWFVSIKSLSDSMCWASCQRCNLRFSRLCHKLVHRKMRCTHRPTDSLNIINNRRSIHFNTFFWHFVLSNEKLYISFSLYMHNTSTSRNENSTAIAAYFAYIEWYYDFMNFVRFGPKSISSIYVKNEHFEIEKFHQYSYCTFNLSFKCT